ncbi:YozQ family protein [Neobacillus sp. SM06]|uniref:YozQ family protein n=1 Tax=Neobacillus sp. SM06 TaxID=3422492 RepID=UPI003D282BF6
MNKKDQKSRSQIAGRFFKPSDYQQTDALSSGLATTHEQVTDAYMEGEIGGVIEDAAGKDLPLPKQP